MFPPCLRLRKQILYTTGITSPHRRVRTFSPETTLPSGYNTRAGFQFVQAKPMFYEGTGWTEYKMFDLNL